MIWKLIAKFCARPAVRSWLISRALKTPYIHIMKGGNLYMQRFWLFNPYQLGAEKTLWERFMAKLPSARIHWIVRPDDDRHLHDHPWQARTIILDGAYTERRLSAFSSRPDGTLQNTLGAGDTMAWGLNDYHSIETVSPGGVWTLFITWKYQGTWGFLVDGKKVPYKQYLGL